MHKRFLTLGALLGGLAVALGAFGAHGLEKVTTDEKVLHGFNTGVQYQMYHALALLLAALLLDKGATKWVNWAGNCFITGIILFSGSLYLLTFLKIQASGATRFVGPITPLGGLFFIGGWVFLLIAFVRKSNSVN
jgi:uncharacterized membrane protein YgdD (TMEM256/DUF423 family)